MKAKKDIRIYGSRNRNLISNPRLMENGKSGASKKDISKRENMAYDEKTDTYICHAGKELQPLFSGTPKTGSNPQNKVESFLGFL